MPNQAKGALLKKQTGCLPPPLPPPSSFWRAAFLTNQQGICALQQGDTSPPLQQSPKVWCVPVGLISARNMTHSSLGLVLSSNPQHEVGDSQPYHLPFALAKLLA